MSHFHSVLDMFIRDTHLIVYSYAHLSTWYCSLQVRILADPGSIVPIIYQFRCLVPSSKSRVFIVHFMKASKSLCLHGFFSFDSLSLFVGKTVFGIDKSSWSNSLHVFEVKELVW